MKKSHHSYSEALSGYSRPTTRFQLGNWAPTHMKKYALVLTCCCISACGSDNASSQETQKPNTQVSALALPATGSAIKYEMKTIKKQIPDTASPIGSWEIDKSCPVMRTAPRQDSIASLNQKIMALVDQYTCEGKGDETFTGKVTLAGDRVFSMRYESMWMCATMPSPDSTSGTLNINIKDNSAIDLRNEFAGDSAYNTFLAKTLKRINQKVAERRAQQKVECTPVTQLGNFYITPEALVISTLPKSHGDTACDIELTIPRREISRQLKSGSGLQP